MRVRRHLLKLRLPLLPLAALAVITSVLVGTSAPARDLRAQASSGGGAGRAGNEFGLKVGSATGLRPGGEVTVTVRYSNPYPHPLVVRSQDIQVTSRSSACPAATYVDLAAARAVLSKPVTVPAGKSKGVDLVLSLRATAPDGCQGVRFTTTIRAQGRKT